MVQSKRKSTMFLIIQKSHGTIYVYRESELQFRVNEINESRQAMQRLLENEFDKECDTEYMPDNSYVVIRLY